MILVTGATGNAGSEVVRALLARGEHVRAFVRDPDRARGLLGEQPELALGDFADPASVRAALEGVEQLVLSGPDDPRRVDWETGAIDAAVASGVRRIVRLSSPVVEPGAREAFWDWHNRIDRHLTRSGVAAVVLHSSFYMSNLLAAAEQIADQGLLVAPAGDARIAMIDPRDVGAAAAAVLTTARHDGQRYVLTGPEAITYDEVAVELSAAAGRRVTFVDVPDADAEEGMIRAGLPPLVAEQVVKVFASLREGVARRVTTTVESLTGAPPRSLAAFAHHHAALFTPTTRVREVTR